MAAFVAAGGGNRDTPVDAAAPSPGERLAEEADDGAEEPKAMELPDVVFRLVCGYIEVGSSGRGALGCGRRGGIPTPADS